MTGRARKFIRVMKFLLAGVTVFCVCWIVSINEWHGRWSERSVVGREFSTMRTIVAYSEGKQAEMDRPLPVTCERLPAFPKIPYINRTWSPDGDQESQWQHIPGTKVSLYAAYYDERTPQRYIRILATFRGRNISTQDTLYCQTRSRDPYENTVEVVTAKPLEIWWHEWDPISSEVDTPLFLSCPLTGPLKAPSIVSVVTEPCDDPKNAFVLEFKRNVIKQRNFTVCVKDMNFDKDISQGLVEWIETNKILGADIIDVYVDKVSNETENILRHYRDEGYIRLYNVPISNNPARSLWQRRRDHIITYNDCLYRNIGETEFVVPLDVDEIILPKTTNTWIELVNRLNTFGFIPKEYSAVMIQNVFFFDEIQGISTNISHRNVFFVNIDGDYVKRDDVRITEESLANSNIDLGELELDKNNNVELEYADAENFVKYMSRCGQKLALPKLLKHIVSSAVISPVGFYSKSFMRTDKVLTAFNHYPLASLGTPGFNGWAAPFQEVQLNHYKESCNQTVVVECGQYLKKVRYDRTALRLRKKLLRALAHAPCKKINFM